MKSVRQFLLSFIVLGCLVHSLDAAGRRYARHHEKRGAVRQYVPPKLDTKVRYNANQKARHLHRKAIRAYWQGQYDDANACFALALKSWSDYSTLIQDYTLCSILLSSDFQDLKRAEGLVELDIAANKKRSARSYLVEGMLYVQKGDYQKAYECLIQIRSGEYLAISKTLIERMHHHAPVISEDMIKSLLPIRESLREVRDERGGKTTLRR